ncbi:MAG TPA: response regulator [Polaromonas sp.]|uniref:response regulator n=1 Tax=Polaromonas sp. TaxID=1869339 RepID=UPI002D589446|nr:response regulator [Polaromonas sp.]HYW57832.1 response regulator [Polaromonas sp.]
MSIEQPTSRPTVLVIDDTPSNISLANAILGDTYELKVANSGPRGLAIAQSDPVPDLILLDMMMPGMDGMEVCRRLKQSDVTRDIPVIFLSGMVGSGDEEEGLEAGAVDYIAKPLSPAILLARVAAHVELRGARKKLALLQEQAEAQALDLTECGKALHKFENIVTHDMRSSLNLVNGFANVLKKKLAGEGNEQNLKSLTLIVSGAKQLGELIDSWRTVPALVRQPMRPVPLDMRALAGTAVEEALAKLPDADKPEILMEDLPPSTADESALRQVWQQLVTNALSAMAGTAAPVLRISATVGEGEVVYSVEDNGSGFVQEEHDRLFAPFDSPLDKEKRSGPGLGLFIAEQALIRQRGRIWAEALPAGGARFSFSLPQIAATHPASGAAV